MWQFRVELKGYSAAYFNRIAAFEARMQRNNIRFLSGTATYSVDWIVGFHSPLLRYNPLGHTVEPLLKVTLK